MPEPVIRIEHLSRSFGTITALDDLSLEVPAGIVFGFLGPNGVGKTITIHLLLGLLEPTAGRASVLGFDTQKEAEETRARSGVLLEFAGLYERMSAQDNLDLYGRIYRSLFVGAAIAGERERHTLETLLASRISDPAILLGKIIVMVGTAWGMALASLLLGLLSANLGSGQGRWAFYGSFGLLGEALALSLLTSLLATSVGVVISLRSATVRQALQLVMVAALVVLVGVTPVRPKQAVSALSTEEIWLIAIAVLAEMDTIFLGVLRVRFRHSHMLFF